METITLFRFDGQRVPPVEPHREDVETGYSQARIATRVDSELTAVEEVLLQAWGTLTARGLAL